MQYKLQYYIISFIVIYKHTIDRLLDSFSMVYNDKTIGRLR